MSNTCPPDEELDGFLNEALPEERIDWLSAHVDGCSLCQKRLDRLTHGGDGVRFNELSSLLHAGVASHPEAGTLVNGVHPLPPPPRLTGLPSVPGFDVLAELGRGGMGVVYKARHRRLNRLVALKMILSGCAADPHLVQRFLFEAEILARVQHPQVVQVFEVDTYQGQSGVAIPYLAMEYLEGGSLSRRLRALDRGGTDQAPAEKFLDPRTAAELVEGIARAVHAAHMQGVIHRDLKPGNILFGQADAGNRSSGLSISPSSPGTPLPASSTSLTAHVAKVTDFGLARFIEAGADLTGSGQVVGTPHYMAPEQSAGAKGIGPAADVYSLGAILFECLTGRPPFEGSEPMSVLLKVVNEPAPDVRSFRKDLHRDLAAVVMRCLDKEPKRRYPSANDLADDLRRYLENRPTLARPVGSRERLWMWTKRNPAVAGLVCALAAVLVIGFAAVTSLWMKAEEKAVAEMTAREQAIQSESQAVSARHAAMDSLSEAVRQKRNADLQQAHLEFARGVNWCEEGRVSQGLDSFLRVVELAESVETTDLARVARIQLAAWPAELPAYRREVELQYQPRRIAFFPDGRTAVLAGRGASLIKWDTHDHEKKLTYQSSISLARGPLGFARTFTFWTTAVSPDGKTVAAAGTDGQVWLWDADRPETRTTLVVGPNGMDVWAICFAQDGTLWALDGPNSIARWDTQKNQRLARGSIEGSRGEIQSIIGSADGKRIYTGDRGGAIWEWDADKAIPVRNWKVRGWVTDLAISDDQEFLAATGTDGLVHVLELGTGRKVHELSLAGAYGAGVAFAPKRPLLVASDGDGNVRVWHRTTGVPVGIPFRLGGEVLHPRFLPASDEFLIPAGNAVYRCRPADFPGRLLTDEEPRVRGLDFTPGGDRLAAALERTILLFDTASGARLGKGEFARSALTLRCEPDRIERRFVRGTRDGIDVIGFRDGAFTQHVPKITGRNTIDQVGFLPSGNALFSLERDVVFRWDRDGESYRRSSVMFHDPARPAGNDMKVLDVRPDGREMLVTYANKVIFLDLTREDSLALSRPGWTVTDEILDAKYLPDGKRILIGRRDSIAELVDASTGKRVARPMTHAHAVTSVSANSNGKVLLTGSRDGTARYWDAETGLPLGPPLRHAGPVRRVVYSPKDDQAATGSDLGEVLLWPIPPAPLAGTLEELRKHPEKARQ
jgi:serine/threonine protein kinase/WD40 repeat protein